MYVIKASVEGYNDRYARLHWEGHYHWEDFNKATHFKSFEEVENVLKLPTFTEPVDKGDGIIAHSTSLYMLWPDSEPTNVILEIVEVSLITKLARKIKIINKYPKGVEYKY